MSNLALIAEMTPASMKAIGYGLAAVGAGVGIGLTVNGTVQAIARQPELAGKLTGLMWIGAALAEGFAFIALACAMFF
jgi:F-type H+-transporting ATPase subunit c